MAKSACAFICGNDDFLVDREAERIYKEHTQGSEGSFSNETISGSVNNMSDVEAIVKQVRLGMQSMSLFGEDKVIWIKGVNFLADTPTGRAEGTKTLVEDLQQLLSKIPAGVFVVISACPVDRRTKLFKWFKDNADFTYLEEQKNNASVHEVIQLECKKLDISISAEAKDILINKVGGSTRLACNELLKLATYNGDDKNITPAMVLELVPDFGESDFFEPVEAFFSGDTAWALDSLNRYFFNNNDARPIIASLQNRNRLLIQLKILLEAQEIRFDNRGGLDKSAFDRAKDAYDKYFDGTDAKSSYNVFTQNLWYLGKLAQSTRQLSMKRLIDFQSAFLKAFEQLISSSAPQKTILETLFLSCLAE